MSFKCEACNYETNDNFNYKRHNNSKKHAEKIKQQTNISSSYHKNGIENELKCIFCNNTYTNPGNLSRHKITCSEKRRLVDALNEQIKITEQKEEALKQKDEIIKQKDETIAIQKLEIIHLKSLINNTGTIIKTSVSTMAYVIKNYKEAPPLESIKDYSLLHYEQTNAEFVENLIIEHKNNTLHIYVSDFIVKTYKKEDPSQQSL